MAEKRYYWLKLQEDFFKSLRIKKLRRLAGGDTFTIIYLKMQLMTLKSDGILQYKGIEPTFAEELALDMDESADNVDITIRYLLSCGLLETSDNREFFVPYTVANTGQEGSSAKRVREHRERKALQSNDDVTPPALQSNDDVTPPALHCYGEKEIDKERELDKEIEVKKSRAKRFEPPTLEDVQAYCQERNKGVDPERWYNHYTANGWMVGKNKMKDWKAAVRTWEAGVQRARQERRETGGNIFMEMLEEERGR